MTKPASKTTKPSTPAAAKKSAPKKAVGKIDLTDDESAETTVPTEPTAVDSPSAEKASTEPDSPLGNALLQALSNPITTVSSQASATEVASSTAELDSTEPDDTQTIGLPPIFDVQDPESISPTWEIRLYKQECTTCSALVTSGKGLKDVFINSACGPAKNTACPARYSRVVFQGRRDAILAKFKDARLANDSKRISRILAAIAEEDPISRDHLYKQIGLLPA